MKVAVIGASGNVGTRITEELLKRGHEVTAVVRHPEAVSPRLGVTAKRGDVNDETRLAQLLAGHDAVVSSVKFEPTDPQSLIGAVRRSGVGRLLVVGGAGSLEVAPGVQLVDAPGFPEPYKPEALAGRDFLNVLRGERDLGWTYISPSAEFVPGERTGKFRLGGDQLLVGPGGASRVSYEDFAVALVDELETPKHTRRRFTVGY